MRDDTGLPAYFASAVALFTMLFVAAGLGAQQPLSVTAEDVECLPIEGNGVAWAQVANNVPDTTVRLSFRRTNDTVEDLYYVFMHPAGQGRYWGVFPKAENRQLDRHELIETREEIQQEYLWAAWWREKDASENRDPNDAHEQLELDNDLIRERASLGKKLPRDWLAEMDDATFQRWLEHLENEPAEYFVTVHDAEGRRLARSPTRITEVRSDCRSELSEQERGEARNLTVGETAHWQREEQIFHWLCDGIVSRIGPIGVLRGDGVCRACVIARREGSLLLNTAAMVFDQDPAPSASADAPSQ